MVRSAMSYRERAGDVDACWCVVDVDAHATLDRAIALASSAGVKIAVSNPCFEIWLLWHYADHTAHASGDRLRQILRGHGHRDKALPAGFPFGNYPAACGRAEQAAPECAPGARGPNPSSAVSALANYLIEAGGTRPRT